MGKRENCADWLALAYVANVPLGLGVPTLCTLELGAGFFLLFSKGGASVGYVKACGAL